jgi:hypothetical protein
VLAAGDYVNDNVTGPFTIAYTKGLAQLYAYFLGRNEDSVRYAVCMAPFHLDAQRTR